MRSRDPDLNAARREAILAAAADRFVAGGFHATSMKEICTAAGMSPGTLYHYYPSKSDIIAGIIETERRRTAELLAGVVGAPDLRAALFDALDAIASQVEDRDLVLQAEVAAEVLRQPHLRQAALAAEREAEAGLAEAIAAGQVAGQVERTLDPADAARAILALVDGTLGQAALHGMPHVRRSLPMLRRAITCILSAPGGGSP